MRKVLSLLKLIRPTNAAMVGFAVLVGAWVTGFSLDSRLLLGFLTGFLLAGASMALNDYFDREVDAIDKPYRPIPSGSVKPSEALAAVVLLAGAGLVAALSTGALHFLIAASFLCVAAAYDAFGKRLSLAGNCMVASCIAIPFIYGSLLVDISLRGLPLVFAALAFTSVAGREVTKGIADLRGDREKGCRTLAIVAGPKRAAQVAVALYAVTIGLAMSLPLTGWVGILYTPFVAAACAGFGYSSAKLLRKQSPEVAKRVKSEVLVWMLLGLTGFGAGRCEAV